MSARPHGSEDPVPSPPALAEAEKALLLALARAGLERHLGLATSGPTPDDPDLPAVLRQPAGAFVTLHSDGELRGCIGSLLAGPPLARAVSDLAVAAATRDPRFSPVTPAEAGSLHMEISVLGPLTALQRAAQVRPGVHGLIVGRGARRGVLLPQVAVEHAWDAPTFLSQTCQKAGLPADAWRAWDRGEDAEFTVEAFTALVFGEPRP